jgi:single-strand DNA-binding protein
MPENVTVLVGNLTDDPELRYTPNGVAVTNFRLAVTPRVKDPGGGWRDGETSFIPANVWRDTAENVAESDIGKGTRVVVTGRLRTAPGKPKLATSAPSPNWKPTRSHRPCGSTKSARSSRSNAPARRAGNANRHHAPTTSPNPRSEPGPGRGLRPSGSGPPPSEPQASAASSSGE